MSREESSYTAGLIRHLQRTLEPRPVIFKHHDEATSGILDHTVSWHGATSWLESKAVKGEACILLRGARGHRQLVTGVQLEHATRLRCWFLGFSPQWTTIYAPSHLLAHRDESSWIIEPSRQFSLKQLCVVGVIRLPGVNYSAVEQLIRETHP